MFQKPLVFLLAAMMLFALAACGGGPTVSESGGQENTETPDAPSFSVATEGEPPGVYGGVVMANAVPEGCTKLVYSEGRFCFEMPSEPSMKTIVDYVNEKVMPEIAAISDDGECLTKDNTGTDVLGIGVGTQAFRAFESVGYEVVDGAEYVYPVVNGQSFGTKRLVSSTWLLDVRYVYDRVLYHVIVSAYPEEQEISVTILEEPSQNYEIKE